MSLKQYQTPDVFEVGLDEAGRGCLFGPVCIAGVSWLDKDPEGCIEIKDSKKCSEKYRKECYDIIIKHSNAFSIQMIDSDTIDKENILRCSLNGMHLCLDEISKFFNQESSRGVKFDAKLYSYFLAQGVL